MAEELEFIDCGSLSISYDATGKVTISLSVVRNDRQPITRSRYENRRWGEVDFTCIMMSASQSPIIGSRGWNQWAVQMEGVGNR